MPQLTRLFTPWKLCGFPIANRICVPPLVIYTWDDESGCVTEKHLAHYRALAAGGAGLVIQEATAVSPAGQSSYANENSRRKNSAAAVAAKGERAMFHRPMDCNASSVPS